MEGGRGDSGLRSLVFQRHVEEDSGEEAEQTPSPYCGPVFQSNCMVLKYTHPYTPIKHQASSIKSQTKYKEFVVSGEYETMQKFTNKNIKANKQCKESIKISSVSRNQEIKEK